MRQKLISKLLLSASVKREARKGMKWGGEETPAGDVVTFFPLASREKVFLHCFPWTFLFGYLQKHKQCQKLPTAPSKALSFPSSVHSPCSC